MPTIIYTLIFLLLAFGVITLGKYFFHKFMDQRRSLNKIHLRILIPRKDSDSDEKKETIRDFKEQIGLMEQLLLSMTSLYGKKIVEKFFGQRTFSFEYVAHDNEVYFHMCIPRKYQVLIEKQVTSFYPDAVIDEVDEVNIFEGENPAYANTVMYLNKEFVYPIKTYQKLESDPINNITNAFSKLGEGESSVVQILLKPVKNSWQKKASKKASELQKKRSHLSLNPLKWITGFFGVLMRSNDDAQNQDSGGEQSSLESETVKLIDEKGKKVGYDTIIRVMTTGPDQNTCDMQLKNIISTFEQFTSPETNSFTYTNYHSKAKVARNYIYRLFSRAGTLRFKKMILNSEELASIFHFPHNRYNQTPEIKWQNFKIVKAPQEVPQSGGVMLGHNFYRGQRIPVHLKDEDRMRHFYVIGQTGVGKTTILLNTAMQDVKAGRGVAVMDPHGDFANDLLQHVPRERADDVIYFNPGDLERPIGINLLEGDSPDEKEMVAQEANKMMIKLYGNEVFGPRIQDYFLNAVLTLLDSPMGGTLCDVMPMVSNKNFQDERRRTLQNKVVKSWWENMYDQQADREKKEILPYFQAKFSPFSTNEMMRNIIGQTQSSFKIHEAMDTGKILLLNLSKGLLGDLNSNLLGMIFVSKIQTAALRRQKIAKEDRRDFFFFIDEFQNFVTDSIESILSEARKYRLSLSLAHQYLGQLEKSDALTKSNVNLKDAVFGNVGTIMSYKVGAEDAEKLEREFSPNFAAADLTNMDKYKGVMRLMVDGQVTRAFSLIPENPYTVQGDPKLMKAIVELSRLKYGREREFIDKEILFRIGSGG